MAVGIAAEVKNKLSVVDVVGESVVLKKAGTTYKGLCPFHGEHTPSFVVTPNRQTWHCFGCGLGGDVFSFVMQRDNVSFPEALKTLAAKAGIELDEHSRRDDARKARLRDVLESAIAFYHQVLTAHRLGQPALAYLQGRGFTDETITRFQLGWAPAGWDTMSRALQTRRNVTPAELAEVGLTTSRASGRGAYDRFRERIMFPIRDANGGPVGFGGRLLPSSATDGHAPSEVGGRAPGGHPPEDHGPKYLNSPATPTFDKSRTLYLIDKAKSAIRKSGQVVIVEGYTDALMAHQAGFDTVVASLGTALTPGQVALATRYATKIALAYDVDPAGQSAGSFGVTELNSLISEVQQADEGIGLTGVGVVRLPEGKDPDEVIRDDPQVWREAVRSPVPILDYLIDYHAGKVDIRTADGRKRLVDAVIPVLRRVADPTVRAAGLQKLSQRSTVDERDLHEALRARTPEPGTGRAGRGGPGEGDHGGTRLTLEAVRAARASVTPDEVLRAVTPIEAELLRLLLLVPDQQLRVVDELGPDQLPSTVARELYRAIVLMRAPDDRGVAGHFDEARLRAGLDEETRALAIAVKAHGRFDPGALPAARINYEVENLLLDLEADRIEERNQYNLSEQAEAERLGDLGLIERLLNQNRQINEERRSLDRRREQARLFARPVAART